MKYQKLVKDRPKDLVLYVFKETKSSSNGNQNSIFKME